MLHVLWCLRVQNVRQQGANKELYEPGFGDKHRELVEQEVLLMESNAKNLLTALPGACYSVYVDQLSIQRDKKYESGAWIIAESLYS